MYIHKRETTLIYNNIYDTSYVIFSLPGFFYRYSLLYKKKNAV